MPRADRNAAIGLVTSWLTGLSSGHFRARQVTSPHTDIEVVDRGTGRTIPLKVAVREFSQSDREGKNFQIRKAVLCPARDGIIVLLYLNDDALRQRGDPIKATWVLSYREFLSQGLTVSSNGAYQCRPVFSPTDRDAWSPYRCFTEQALVDLVTTLCARQPATGEELR